MRDIAAAQVSTSAAEVAYLAAVLSDKAQPMLQRLSASAAAAAARPPKAPKSAKRERETPAPDQGPQETKKLKVKLGGGSANGQGSNSGKGPQGGSGHDRWMAECADCGEEGDLLCCEAKDCPVAMHMECAGLDKVPRGKWYCPEHAASLGKSSKAKPSSAKSSGNLDNTLAPSNAGKAAAAGASAPSKAGSNSKAAAGGKAGRAHSEDDSSDGQAPKKGGKAGKGKVLGEEDAAEGRVPKKGGGKAGKNRTAAEQTDALPKAPSKTTIKLKTGGSSKAGKARPDAASAAAADASGGKPTGGDVPASADRPANGNGAKANKGKEPARKRSADDKTLQKGAGDAAAQAKKKAPEGKFEASDISEKGSVKVKFKRLKKHQE